MRSGACPTYRPVTWREQEPSPAPTYCSGVASIGRVTTSKRVSLALGGGGARGYAHIGVLQVLEEQGYEVVGLAGTSMGALVGGVYAAGKLDEFTDWASNLGQRDLFKYLDPTLRGPGGLKGGRIMSLVSELLDGVRIEELPMPYTAVATDLLARKEVWFQEGPLETAVRTSIALPTFMTPVMLNGRLLADGSMMNPVPIAPLSGLDADLSIAVNLSGDPDGPAQVTLKRRESADPRPVAEWQEKIRRTASQVFGQDTGRRIAGWFSRDDAEAEHTDESVAADEVEEHGKTPVPETGDGFDELPADLGMLALMELSLDAMQSVLTRYRFASYPPDVMVTMPKTICRTLDFHRGAEMIEVGRQYATRALARYEEDRTEVVGSTDRPEVG